MVDYQVLFNMVMGVFGVFLGWMLNAAWGSLKELQKADVKLAEKVASIEVLVAGQYVTREEFSIAITSLFAKLDKIQDAVSGKH